MSTAAIKGTPKPITKQMTGYKVMISAIGQFRFGEVVSSERLLALVTQERLDRLVADGALAIEWE